MEARELLAPVVARACTICVACLGMRAVGGKGVPTCVCHGASLSQLHPSHSCKCVMHAAQCRQRCLPGVLLYLLSAPSLVRVRAQQVA